MKIVLCSASPRRKELLRRIVSEFTVRTAQTDENIQEADCEQRVPALALRKARAVVMQAERRFWESHAIGRMRRACCGC